MDKRIRLSPYDREVSIILAAMRLAARHPIRPLTRRAVAKEAGCCPSLITYYFGRMTVVEQTVIAQAVVLGEMGVLGYAIAQGLPGGDQSQRAAAAARLA